jgi:hypothetical protein
VRRLPASVDSAPGAYLSEVGEGDEPHETPGLELARTDRKVGRARGSRSPFAILADHERHGRPADWRLFEEWMLVGKGRATLVWSRGLRAELLPDVEERTDEEVAAEVGEAEAVVTLAPSVWGEVVRDGLTVALLQAAEAAGCRGVVTLLEAAGVEVVMAVDRDGRGPPRVSCSHFARNWQGGSVSGRMAGYG